MVRVDRKGGHSRSIISSWSATLVHGISSQPECTSSFSMSELILLGPQEKPSTCGTGPAGWDRVGWDRACGVEVGRCLSSRARHNLYVWEDLYAEALAQRLVGVEQHLAKLNLGPVVGHALVLWRHRFARSAPRRIKLDAHDAALTFCLRKFGAIRGLVLEVREARRGRVEHRGRRSRGRRRRRRRRRRSGRSPANPAPETSDRRRGSGGGVGGGGGGGSRRREAERRSRAAKQQAEKRRRHFTAFFFSC